MIGAQLVLDVRMSRRLLRGEQLVRIVDGLRPGERMLIISAEDPEPLVSVVQAERPFTFDVLRSEQPELHHVQLLRRHRARPRTIGECVRWEYRLFEVQLARLSGLVSGGRWARAKPRARSLARAFGRHLRIEQCAIFRPPTLSPRGGESSSLLVSQHRAIAAVLADVVRETELHHDRALELSFAQLRMLLAEHERRERPLLETERVCEIEAGTLREYLRARRSGAQSPG